jgi:TRAP-type C4-dicarboxylate transport system substrate-binding protein
MNVAKKLVLAVLIMALAFPAYSFVIKIGSSAPARSPWGKSLMKLGREWKKITGGKVSLKIYPGGIAGNEDDMVRKMRMGILGGAVITNRGFVSLCQDIYVLNTPLLIDNDDELSYVMERMGPSFEESIEKKGFKVVIITMAGWLHFFSRKPLHYPADLKAHKLAFTVGEPEMEQAFKKSGYHIVPTDLKDMMMGLQGGMMDAFYLPPLIAASGQYFPLAPHMSSRRVAPMIGGMVLTGRTWERIPEEFRPRMMAVAREISGELYRTTVQLEKEAVDTMKKHGLKIVDFPPGALSQWRAAAAKGMDQLIGKAFSKQTYDRLINLLEEFREKNAENN